MKAAVTLGIHEVAVRDVPCPTPQRGEVRVKIFAAGICGGDVRMYNGTFPYLNYPIINGHEFCGVVDYVGEGVVGISVGDYVTAEPIVSCGKCYACSIGKPNCCSELKVLGVHVDGCFSEYICVGAEHIHKLPNTISPLDACLIEPYGIGMHALNRLQLKPGESLLILGAGPIGLSALDIAKSMGVRAMITDLFPTRLAIAEKMGADLVVDSNSADLPTLVAEFTNGEGFPAVLEATGVPAVMQTTQEYVANGGRICLAGVTNKPVTFSTMLFCNKEATVLGTRNSYGVFPGLIDLFEQKKLHPEFLRTNTYSLDDYEKAIEMAAKSTADVCKVVVSIC